MAMKIGVLLDSFKLPFEEALESAARLQVDGVQFYTTSGKLAAWGLDSRARRKLRSRIESRGLAISALCGDLGGHGFERAEENKERIRKTEAIVDLAGELGAPVVTTHVGVIPERKNQVYRNLLLSMREVASYARMHDTTVAIETGPEPALRLRAFIDDVGEESLGVNFDPANFVMVQGADPVECFEILREFVFHTHAKDGRMVKKGDPAAIYSAFADGAPDGLNFDDYFLELPLGDGDVDIARYVGELTRMKFDGYLTIERESGDDRPTDIANGVALLRRLTRPSG